MSRATRAIVLAGAYGGLPAVRCLKMANIPTLVIGAERFEAALLSRFPEKLFLPSRSKGEDWLCEELLKLRKEGDVLLPSSDLGVLFLLQYRAVLERAFHLAVPPESIALTLLDKVLEVEAISKLGIPVPRSVTSLPTNPYELERRLRFPIILKPRMAGLGHAWKNVFLSHSEELKAFFAAHPAKLSSLVAQEYVPGDESMLWTCTCVFDRDHKLVSAVTFRKVRTSPRRDGVITVARSEHNAEVIELSRALGEGLGYVGLADMEFKFDAQAKEYKYIETNPRLIHTCEFVARCGVNQVAQAYDIARGMPARRSMQESAQGFYYVNFLADVKVRLESGQPLFRFLIDTLSLFGKPSRGTLFLLSDPLPIFAPWLRVISRVAAAQVKKLRAYLPPLRGTERA